MTREEIYKHYYNEGYNAGCVKGYEQAIKKTCEWLDNNIFYDEVEGWSVNHYSESTEELIEQFKKAMKGD